MTQQSSHLDELIAAERKRAADKIAKLKRSAAAEQGKIDQKVFALLQEQQPDLYDRVAFQAREILDAEKAERSRKAKDASTMQPVVDEGPPDDDIEEVGASWTR